MLRVEELDELYSLYRFKKMGTDTPNVVAYTFNNGYFSNVDIVPLDKTSNIEEVKKEFEKSGYAANIKQFNTIEQAKLDLFNGFFEIEETKKLIKESYLEYKSRIEKTIGFTYSYIPSTFTKFSEKKETTGNLVEEIKEIIFSEEPTLILIEAAAGYGKTSTAYEILKSVNKENGNTISLLAELSRNRQAQIFKYVLLDEINRQFPGLHLDLVQHHIRDGRIPLIVDGFDELIRGDKEDPERFEETEPMLETVSQMLKGKAKVILTTRKTAIFAGDEFHSWIDSHSGKFNVVRYSLNPPTIEQWLGNTRIRKLSDSGLIIKDLANPVLLSFLRSLTDEEFETICEDTDRIVSSYFEKMLEREKERQLLIMSPDEQKSIFEIISTQMVKDNITTESREYFERVTLEQVPHLLQNVRSRYTAQERPTMEQLAKKIALHALLDRKGGNEEKVGFINDFIFGTFIGDWIYKQPEKDWLQNEQFAELAITAYKPRAVETKYKLWSNLEIMIEFLADNKKLDADIWLTGEIKRNFENGSFDEYVFDDQLIGGNFHFKNCTFNNCSFTNSRFNFSSFDGAYFLQCSFFNCDAINKTNSESLFFANCLFENSDDIESAFVGESKEFIETRPPEIDSMQINVLERFWPLGRSHLTVKRKLKTLYLGKAPEVHDEIKGAIERLRKSNFLVLESDKAIINIEKISEIKSILGRD